MFRTAVTLLLLLALTSVGTAQSPGSAGEGSRAADAPPAAKQERRFAIGMSAWPTEWYCSGPMTATMQQVHPREVLKRIQLAARCGMRLFLVPPRRLLTEGKVANGRFSTKGSGTRRHQ